MAGTPEYVAWSSMKDRCFNEKNEEYHNYGARGITVCLLWINSFMAFFEHVGKKPSSGHKLDRIDNDGNYRPGNVRWATPLESGRNTRRARNITFNGKTQCASAWSLECGKSVSIICWRLDHGWGVEDALTIPPEVQNKSNADYV
jgi:hypothetical protein